MMRSLSSAVSGLKNLQVSMDVIGNNISNVNTTGYKTQRVTYVDSFSQLLAGATQSESKNGGTGGTNPMQVGLGVSVGSVDRVQTDGSVTSTDRTLDLAISGDSFFGVSDGFGTYYTRNGAFELDSEGNVVLSSNGMILQGLMAQSDGTISENAVVGNVRIPFSEQSPAKATTEVTMARNLNADSYAKGSVIYSQTYLHAADSTRPAGTNSTTDPGRTMTPLVSLYNSNGNSLNIEDGDTLTLSFATTAGGTPLEVSYEVVGDPAEVAPATVDAIAKIYSMDDLLAQVNGALTAAGVAATATLDGSTGIVTVASTSSLFNMQIASSNPLSSSYVTKAFNVGSYIGPAVGAYQAKASGSTDAILRPAEEYDMMSSVLDSNGDALGLEVGDQININGSVGEDPMETGVMTYNPASTTMAEMLDMVRNTYQLPQTDGTVAENQSVSLNAAGSDDGIPDGTLVIRGMQGANFALSDITINATNSNSLNPEPNKFNTNMGFTSLQKAKDTDVFSTAISVYDTTGAEHVLTMKFVQTTDPGVWEWSANFAGNEDIVSGGSGTLTFGEDGTVATFLYDDGSSSLIIDPNNGAQSLNVDLQVGGPGNFNGLTQFASQTTAQAESQDGYPTGSLTGMSINSLGVINGTFSNGTSHTLAQIMLVNFSNPSGLVSVSDSVFTTSANSGDPVFSVITADSSSSLTPGALESSNVDLASEFTNMIVTQRGYQANSRVITVSDSMLEELISLKR